MKALRLLFILILSASLTGTTFAQDNSETAGEEAKGIGLTFSIDLTSKYIWRALDLNHKDPTLQPSVSYSFPFLEGLSLNAWSWIGGKNKKKGDKQITLDEVDLTLTYERELIPEKLMGGISLINYNYLSDWSSADGENKNDFEISAALYYTVNQFFVPYIAYYRGLDKGESDGIAANYLECGMAGAYAFNDQWNIAPSLSLAYSDQFTEIAKKGLNHIVVNVPVTYNKDNIAITPSVSLVKPLRDLNTDKKKIIVFGGINLSYGF